MLSGLNSFYTKVRCHRTLCPQRFFTKVRCHRTRTLKIRSTKVNSSAHFKLADRLLPSFYHASALTGWLWVSLFSSQVCKLGTAPSYSRLKLRWLDKMAASSTTVSESSASSGYHCLTWFVNSIIFLASRTVCFGKS